MDTRISFRRRALLSATGAAALTGLGTTARAQGLPAGVPSGTIRILAGFPPGGGTDLMARQIAEKLRERTGANIVVENRSGASGVIAIDALKKAPADGTVLMYGTSATTVAQSVNRKSPGFDLERDMTPLGLTGVTCTAYGVSSTLGVKNLPEYIAWLKQNPQRHNFGTTALGSNTQFVGNILGQSIGFPLEAVAYKGAAPLMGDLMAGHIPAGCGGLTDFLTQHQADRLRIIGVSSQKRSASAPDIPTFAELGHPRATYEGFYGFYGPPKMNPAIVDAWSRELRAATESPDLKQKLQGMGLDVLTSGPAEFVTRQSRLVTTFTEMMKTVGYSPE